jgi:hypothetical protein
MKRISEEITLSDGKKATLRNFVKQDLEKIYDFYNSLPEEEKNLMRIDVRDKNAVSNRVLELEEEHADRMVVELSGQDAFIGEATLEPMRYGWMRKTGEIRLRMAAEYEPMSWLILFVKKSSFWQLAVALTAS